MELTEDVVHELAELDQEREMSSLLVWGGLMGMTSRNQER